MTFETCLKAQLGQKHHTSMCTCGNLAKMQIGFIKLNQFSTSLADLKQTYLRSFSAFWTLELQPPSGKNLHTLSFSIFAHCIFLAKSQKPSSILCFYHHLDFIWSSLQPSNPCWKFHFVLCFLKVQPWQILFWTISSIAKLELSSHSSFRSFTYICLEDLQANNIQIITEFQYWSVFVSLIF